MPLSPVRSAGNIPEQRSGWNSASITIMPCFDKAVKLEQEGRLIIIAPDDICGMDTLTRDRGERNAVVALCTE